MTAGIDYSQVDVDRERKRGERSDEEIRCVENARALRRILAAVLRIAESGGALRQPVVALGSIAALSGRIALADLLAAALCAEAAAAGFESIAPSSTTNAERDPMRHLNPNAPATDERVQGRVRDERASAETVEISAEQGEKLTDRAMLVELRDALLSLIICTDRNIDPVNTLPAARASLAKAIRYLGGE